MRVQTDVYIPIVTPTSPLLGELISCTSSQSYPSGRRTILEYCLIANPPQNANLVYSLLPLGVPGRAAPSSQFLQESIVSA